MPALRYAQRGVQRRARCACAAAVAVAAAQRVPRSVQRVDVRAAAAKSTRATRSACYKERAQKMRYGVPRRATIDAAALSLRCYCRFFR